MRISIDVDFLISVNLVIEKPKGSTITHGEAVLNAKNELSKLTVAELISRLESMDTCLTVLPNVVNVGGLVMSESN